jgi:hypothetical protein
MKTTKRKIINLATFSLMLWTAQAAVAFYNPEIGRWANRDPMGETAGLNLYSFCEEDPVDFADNLGLQIVIPVPGPRPVGVPPWPMPTPPQYPPIMKRPTTLHHPLPTKPVLPHSTCTAVPAPINNTKKHCDEALVNCIDDPWQPPNMWDQWGKRKDCRACYNECLNDGAWPNYKCPQ